MEIKKLIKFNIIYSKINKFKKAINQNYAELYQDSFDDILIIAPHQDDDVIGCGGVLLKNKTTNKKVIFVTDGSNGDKQISRKEMKNLRKKEAIESLNSINVDNIYFMDIEDGEVRGNIDNYEKIFIDEMSNYKNIFIPFIYDNHDDHRAVAEFIVKILRKNRINKKIWMYEVWSPLIPNKLVDITIEIDEKLEAIKKHKSQIENIDYSEKIKGLNAYRSIGISNKNNKNIKFCEAYFMFNSLDKIKF